MLARRWPIDPNRLDSVPWTPCCITRSYSRPLRHRIQGSSGESHDRAIHLSRIPREAQARVDCWRLPPGHTRPGLPRSFRRADTAYATGDLGLYVGGSNGSTARWSWTEFEALPHERVNTDIHCVTKWSKLDTVWEGVSIDTLLTEAASRGVDPRAVRARSLRSAGTRPDLPLADVTGGKAWVAVTCPAPRLHRDAAARLLVPAPAPLEECQMGRARLTFLLRRTNPILGRLVITRITATHGESSDTAVTN